MCYTLPHSPLLLSYLIIYPLSGEQVCRERRVKFNNLHILLFEISTSLKKKEKKDFYIFQSKKKQKKNVMWVL